MSLILNRRILVAVSGMSPQIITETLYALFSECEWLPDEIRLITTSKGRENADSQLLHRDGYFHRLLRDYNITQPIRFDEDTIHVICDANGSELQDLRTPEDNEAAADYICKTIRELTEMPDTELHVSLAGGRKTMGFYAGYALSLFGREQDRLSHVLVSEEYESLKDFFYPTPEKHLIHKDMLDAAKAEVWLADIPFVRLRNRLPRSLREGGHGFSETVDLARRATEKPKLILLPRSRAYIMNGIRGELRPVEMALFLWTASRRLQCLPPIPAIVEGEKRPDYVATIVDLADKHNLNLHGKTLGSLENGGVTHEWLEQNCSRLKGSLEKTLGLELASLCKLVNGNHRDGSGYALPGNLEISIE